MSEEKVYKEAYREEGLTLEGMIETGKLATLHEIRDCLNDIALSLRTLASIEESRAIQEDMR